MNEQTYLEQRLQDQIDWFDRKSQAYQTRYKHLRMLEILAASSIPFLSGYTETLAYITPTVGMLGLLITIIAGLLSLNQYQERWLEYRSTAEALKQEKFLYLTRTEPYDGERPFNRLVQRVEGRLAKENSVWAQAAVKESHSAGDNQPQPSRDLADA
ncbi:DUF4231 domain-containing protein [Methylomagnum sp.]